MKHTNSLFILLFISLALTFTACGGGGGGGNEEVVITYNANGATSGTVPASQKVISGQTFTVQSNSGNLERTGYIFDGWNYYFSSSRGPSKQRIAEGGLLFTGDMSDKTLYARWVVLPTMISIPGQDFKMSKTEVTIELYMLITGDYDHDNVPFNHFYEQNYGSLFDHDLYPADSISWYAAVKFCNDLSSFYGLNPVYTINGSTVTQDLEASGFRLPTKVEWEYAAAGGEAYIYAGSDNIDEVAWYPDNCGYDLQTNPVTCTHPVAQKKVNGYGLYDMTGNVSEWCWDTGTGSLSTHRYLRGGSWDSIFGFQVNSTSFEIFAPETQSSNVGFRIVCKK